MPVDSRRLSPGAAEELRERGFVVLPGSVPPDAMDELSNAYDAVVSSAVPGDIKFGRTSTRVGGLVNRGAEFDSVYVLPALLEACGLVIGGPFKLSSFHARTVRPGAMAQEFHADVQRESTDWPLLGFILMVDAFRPDNGATRLVPGSHRWPGAPAEAMRDPQSAHPDQVLACGDAGSLLVFNGSVWHGHGANTSNRPRRSVQGAFVPTSGHASIDFAAIIRPDTRARLGPLARQVLGL